MKTSPSPQPAAPARPSSVKVRGVRVDLDWSLTNVPDSLGIASHTVSQSALDDGTADGPRDGDTLTIAGARYTLGQHDYDTDGDETTCSAHIYAAESEVQS